MSRYADLDALEKELNERLTFLRERNGSYDQYTDGFDEAVDRVENFQTADVAPVVHGRWARDADGDWYCTNCNEVVAICESGRERTYRKPYCPNCGAKMNSINEENNKGEVK